MIKKMSKLLTNNLGLKIAAILVTIILWMVVVNINDPDSTKPFTIPVTVQNEEILAEMGKVYDVIGDTSFATIYVTGKRSYMDKLSTSDFKATADLSQIDFLSDTDIKLVPINISAARYEKELEISQKTMNLQISIEDLSTEQFYISGYAQGTPAEGYAIGEVEVSPNLIKVSGPQSIVSKVKRVVANVNVAGANGDVTANVVPVLYDVNDSIIESSQLKLNQEKVTVSVQMLGTKTVSVRCLTNGTPEDGYVFINLEYAPETLMIKGEPEILNHIYEIVIPGEAINLDGATGDVENSIDITPYLNAAGVSLVNSDENKIAVKAIVERLEAKNLELATDALTVRNLKEGYKVVFGAEAVTVTVRGRSENMPSLTLADISGSIDLEGLEIGEHSVEVQMKTANDYEIVGTVTISLNIVEDVPEDTGGGNGTEDGEAGNGGSNNGGTAAGTPSDENDTGQ